MAAQRKRKEISHLHGHRNEQDNGDEAQHKVECYICSWSVRKLGLGARRSLLLDGLGRNSQILLTNRPWQLTSRLCLILWLQRLKETFKIRILAENTFILMPHMWLTSNFRP